MGDFIAQYQDGLVVVLFLVIVIMLILIFGMMSGLRRMKRSYRMMMNGTGVENLEQLLIEMQNGIAGMEETVERLQAEIEEIKRKQTSMVGSVGVLRYNAFGDRGSDLSFSLALLDEQQNGVVISAIHSRGESLLYAKPLEEGQSRYTLSPEEEEAIVQALKKVGKAGR